jgi:hypothetical protein
MQPRGVYRVNQNNHEILCGAGAGPFPGLQSMNEDEELQEILRHACLVVDRTLIMQRQTSSLIGPNVKAFGMCDMV